MYCIGALIWEFFCEQREKTHVNCIIILMNSLGILWEFFCLEFFGNSLGILQEFLMDLWLVGSECLGVDFG